MQFCTAKERIDEVKGEIEFLVDKREGINRDLAKKRKELRELEESFKLPGFFKELDEPGAFIMTGYSDQVKNVTKPYQRWMLREVIKYDGFKCGGKLSCKIVFADFPIEVIYNKAIDVIPEMKAHPNSLKNL